MRAAAGFSLGLVVAVELGRPTERDSVVADEGLNVSEPESNAPVVHNVELSRMLAARETIANGGQARFDARPVSRRDRGDVAGGPSLARPLAAASMGSPGWSRFQVSATVGGPGLAPQVGQKPGLTLAWCPQVAQRHWRLSCMAAR